MVTRVSIALPSTGVIRFDLPEIWPTFAEHGMDRKRVWTVTAAVAVGGRARWFFPRSTGRHQVAVAEQPSLAVISAP
jgi:hypothetical protein